jgi:hypothetical protein
MPVMFNLIAQKKHRVRRNVPIICFKEQKYQEDRKNDM